MTETDPIDIFAVATPGLDSVLLAEIKAAGFADARLMAGGVGFPGSWSDVWRANLELRGATRILARIASFRAMHLAQLDKRARKLGWAGLLRPDVPFRVEASCHKSRIYHAGAAAERVRKAIVETLGAPTAEDAELRILVRIEDDLVTISVDTSGASLHKRGFKQAVARAPLRETMAALFLRQAGYDGSGLVLDPMCGSGTIVIEAAEIARGLQPGRARHFAFEHLPSFDADSYTRLRRLAPAASPAAVPRFFGVDRDPGAIRMAVENAARAGVADLCQFTCADIADLEAPATGPGLVIVNPPYGARIGNTAPLASLYRTLGARLKAQFAGWSVAIVATDQNLVRATGLGLEPAGPPVLHGGLRVHLWTAKH